LVSISSISSTTPVITHRRPSMTWPRSSPPRVTEIEAVCCGSCRHFRSAGVSRQSHGVPHHPAARAEIRLRSGDAGAASTVWIFCEAGSRSRSAHLQRRRRRPRGDDRGDSLPPIQNPALAFGSALVQPIVPDVFVRQGPDGGYIVELNAGPLPRSCQPSYYAEVTKTVKNESGNRYLADCMQTNLAQRAWIKRAKKILKSQPKLCVSKMPSLRRGVQHSSRSTSRPWPTRSRCSESTVSRVTANKYMATNRRYLRIEILFHVQSIAAADGGEATPAEAVRHRIKQLIDAETSQDVLSDDTIVEKLREGRRRHRPPDGREISRGDAIPSSVQAPAAKSRHRSERRADLSALLHDRHDL